MTITAKARQGDTLDEICWRELGTTQGVVEAAFELNRDLAAHGAEIPAGTLVTLPSPAAAAPRTRETVNLWD